MYTKILLKYEYQEMVLLGTNGVFLIPGSLKFVLQGIEVQEECHS
jgi:hypothetical protein